MSTTSRRSLRKTCAGLASSQSAFGVSGLALGRHVGEALRKGPPAGRRGLAASHKSYFDKELRFNCPANSFSRTWRNSTAVECS